VSGPGRGPSGAAPPPPPWLGTIRLPIEPLAPGTPLIRVHRLGLDPVFFGPGPGRPPTYRFDPPSGRCGVLYAALALAGALVETLLRNPQRRMVALADIEARGHVELACRRTLRLARLHGDGLQVVGTDAAIATGPYEPCGLWADALLDHPDAPDGILYASRHDNGQLCVALFERPGLVLEAGAGTPLTSDLSRVAAILARYGKSVSIP
jgi:hypothetical protein